MPHFSHIFITFALIMRRHKLYIALLTALLSTTITAQHYTISGYVTDAAAEETMIGATLYDHAHGNGTVTNTYGFYSLTLPAGEWS